MTKGDIVAAVVSVLVCVLIVVVITATVIGANICDEKGGVYVSGKCFNKEAFLK